MKKEDIKELGIEMVDHLEHLLDKVSSGVNYDCMTFPVMRSVIPLRSFSILVECAVTLSAHAVTYIVWNSPLHPS